MRRQILWCQDNVVVYSFWEILFKVVELVLYLLCHLYGICARQLVDTYQSGLFA